MNRRTEQILELFQELAIRARAELELASVFPATIGKQELTGTKHAPH
ncbi:hypothetical protein Q7L38_14885 [Pseudomonas protegens]|nr:hypothetical protein [Pseudomonas protegens]MDP9533858.1 hypothetical protein [Pseudomonas protegens]